MSLSDEINNFEVGADSEYLLTVKAVQKAIKEVVDRYKKICGIENLNVEWVLNPIYEEFGDKLVRISEGI